MLAADLEMDVSKVRYPCLATPKIDGYRCLVLEGRPLTRGFKDQPNNYIRQMLSTMWCDMLDGELIVPGKPFNIAGGLIRRESGSPPFAFHVFDELTAPHKPYHERIEKLQERATSLPSFISLVYPKLITNEADLLAFESVCLANGYEGVMLRDPHGTYKSGRSTLKEFGLVKLKRFLDSEAVVTGFDELMHNENPKETNELGLTERSSHKENLVGGDTLGALVARWQPSESIDDYVEIRVGTGFTAEDRKFIWDRKEFYLGKTFTFKYQPHGMDVRPRHATFKDWRED
jgi:DNA ligase-1